MVKLGVNIDHVATVREARKTFEPDPIKAALECQSAGCDAIVCHLRKDRRHINDRDLDLLKKSVIVKLNMEMSIDPEIVEIACRVKPNQATLVPENRQEVTTEGGLDAVGNLEKVKSVVKRLSARGIEVSLFIDPETEQVDAAGECGVKTIEFHTGRYAEKFNSNGDYEKELRVLRDMTKYASIAGLTVCAGHGLTYGNVAHVARISKMYELNIGHSIISKAVFAGISLAVNEMKGLIA
ncbi:MAG: pyridoxine 5'-phosphate synthase [Candidatus Omnitrophota bacterium]